MQVIVSQPLIENQSTLLNFVMFCYRMLYKTIKCLDSCGPGSELQSIRDPSSSSTAMSSSGARGDGAKIVT